jgi:predicted kinase
MLHLLVGLPCAGKTTFAKNLENEINGLRLTPDEWQLRLFGQDLEDPDHEWRHDTIEDLMWRVGASVLGHGVPVILDYGFWKKIERDDYRNRAKSLGIPTTIHFLDTPKEILLRRVEIRNGLSKDKTFVIPLEKMHEWYEVFERPDEEELNQNGIPAT